MGLFDLFKKKIFVICTVCNKKITVPDGNTIPPNYICPECNQVKKLQKCDASIIDIERSSFGHERTLTVLFYDKSIGYFCVQQCSGAYSGLAFRYQILPKDITGDPCIEAYVDNDNYSQWIPNRSFSKAFDDDMDGSSFHLTSCIDKYIDKLAAIEEKRLRSIYPDHDAWRAPSNIADSMGCVGFAMYELNNYKSRLESMSKKDIIKLYNKTVK